MKVEIKFQDVLRTAVNEPGKILEAYSAFHNYSFGNQLLIMAQCLGRDIPIGPVATFKAWKDKGRSVKKGEKALALCVPITIKKTKEDAAGNETEVCFSKFTFRNGWFTMAQTEGEPIEQVLSIPDWNKDRALEALKIELVPFELADGNSQGYAFNGCKIAINPVAQFPLKTLFHEMGHIVLGHQDVKSHDEVIPRNLKEIEAESVALLCLAALGLPGQEYCRGYIRAWMTEKEIPEKSAQKIMAAADKILKAGRGELEAS